MCSFGFEEAHFIFFFTEDEVRNFYTSLTQEIYNMPTLHVRCLVKRLPYYFTMKTTVPVKIYNLKFADSWQMLPVLVFFVLDFNIIINCLYL